MSAYTEQVHLLRRPDGRPEPSDFKVVEVKLRDLEDQELLVENLWMSVDPYMRRSMRGTELPRTAQSLI